jgi:hypothetical protein
MQLAEMERIAAAIARSGFFQFRTPEQVLALMFLAQAEGRHPASVARDYDIIQNRPTKRAEAMLRDFLAAGGKVKWHTSSDVLADATFSHEHGGELRIVWDMKKAETAGLKHKDNWKKHPQQMLRWRVISEGIRVVYPAATSGMLEVSEAQDIEPRKAPVAAPNPMIEPPHDEQTGEIVEGHQESGVSDVQEAVIPPPAQEASAPVDEPSPSAGAGVPSEPPTKEKVQAMGREGAKRGRDIFNAYYDSCDGQSKAWLREIKTEINGLFPKAKPNEQHA